MKCALSNSSNRFHSSQVLLLTAAFLLSSSRLVSITTGYTGPRLAFPASGGHWAGRTWKRKKEKHTEWVSLSR